MSTEVSKIQIGFLTDELFLLFGKCTYKTQVSISPNKL